MLSIGDGLAISSVGQEATLVVIFPHECGNLRLSILNQALDNFLKKIGTGLPGGLSKQHKEHPKPFNILPVVDA